MKTFRLLTAVMVAVAGFVAFGAGQTYYADSTKPDDSGDGLSAATAKRTVQAAVALAGDGDTVKLAPGVYDSGFVKSGDATSLDTCVLITNRITLVGSGKGTTFIKGAFSTAADNADGSGVGAARCVTVKASGKGTVIERVTLCGGATFKDTGNADRDRKGGGLWADSSVGYDVCLCDAIVSNCVGYASGGMHHGTAVCCRFFSNRCPSQSNGSACTDVKLSNCIVSRNYNYYAVGHPAVLVNCTVIDNAATALFPALTTQCDFAYNCLILGQEQYNGTSQANSETYAWVASNTVCQAGKAGGWLNTIGKAASGTLRPYAETETLNTNAVYAQCYGPAIGDYRLLPTSDAVNWGNPAHLARIAVPERYRNLDCDLRPFDMNKATCQAGALQTVGPTPASGKLTLTSFQTLANGFPQRASATGNASAYLYTDTWPTQVRLSSTYPAEQLCGYYDSANSHWIYPDLGDLGFWFTMPPAGTDANVYAVEAKRTCYVDATMPDDSKDGLSWGNAKRTIQAAVDMYSESGATLVLVKPGTYAEGGRTVKSLMTRVVITNGQVVVRSTGCAADTFIVGGEDTRCGYFSVPGCIQGFTITGGRASNMSGDAGTGAGLMSTASTLVNSAAADCIISNNAGYVGSATHKCTLYRCRVGSNDFSNGGSLVGATCVSTFLTRPVNQNYLVQNSCIMANCTVDGPTGGGKICNSANTILNCLLRNGGEFQSYNDTYKFCGNVLAGNSKYNSKWGQDSSTLVSEYSYENIDFSLAATESFDCRPVKGVALEGLGASFSYSSIWKYQCGDIDGRPLRFAQAKVMPGAAQSYAESVFVTNVLGGVTVTGGEIGWNSVADGKTVTVEAKDAATRPFLGFRVDGVLRDRSQTSIVLDASYDGKVVEAVYSADWYVDADGGDDANDGQTPDTARKTLEKIMAVKLLPGDTVHAAPGVYDRGSMTNGTSFLYKADGVCSLPSRVVVPNDIRLLADEGPERTFIIGSAAADGARTLGLGLGAVRCATVGKRAVLSGFTLTGGHTLDVGDVPPCENNRDDDLCGAAVLGLGGADSVVDGCIISNNAAYRAGAALYSTLNRCRISDCDAVYEAAATWICHLKGSSLNHFRTDREIIQYYRGVDSSTIGPDIRDASGNLKKALASSNDGLNPAATPTINSVILCKPGVEVSHAAFNSVFLDDGSYVGTYHTNCQTVVRTTGFFDANGAPIAGSGCPALGLADVARHDFAVLGWTDVAGNPRFSNNAMDAGAFQSDWRARYARVLGGSKMSCPAATTNVHETVEGIRLETGSLELCAKFPAKAAGGSAEVEASIDGSGELRVLVDGSVVRTLKAVDSPVAFTVALTTGNERMTFVYEKGLDDVGSATVHRCRIPSGIVLVVR